jgi:hypothetical protein
VKITPEEKPRNWLKYVLLMPVRLVLSLLACAALLIIALAVIVVGMLVVTLLLIALSAVCLGWVIAPRSVSKVSSGIIEAAV